MALKVSTALRNFMLSDASLKDAMDDGVIKIYGGTVPDTADAALGGATLLCTITDNDQGMGAGQGLDFEASATDGILEKDSAQTWSGTNSATGTATFFRFVQQADDGTASTTQERIQGSIATAGAELNLSSTALVATNLQTIDYFSIALPTL